MFKYLLVFLISKIKTCSVHFTLSSYQHCKMSRVVWNNPWLFDIKKEICSVHIILSSHNIVKYQGRYGYSNTLRLFNTKSKSWSVQIALNSSHHWYILHLPFCSDISPFKWNRKVFSYIDLLLYLRLFNTKMYRASTPPLV